MEQCPQNPEKEPVRVKSVWKSQIPREILKKIPFHFSELNRKIPYIQKSGKEHL